MKRRWFLTAVIAYFAVALLVKLATTTSITFSILWPVSLLVLVYYAIAFPRGD